MFIENMGRYVCDLFGVEPNNPIFFINIKPPSGLKNETVTNPKDLNVYRKLYKVMNTTPMGSNQTAGFIFYKHKTPIGVKK